MAYKQQHKNLAPIDTEVQLPAAIRAAAARANAIHQEAYDTPAAQQEDHGQERQQEEVKAPAATEEVKGGDEKVPATAPAQGGDDHRYNSLKGRYDKQEDTIRQLTDQLGALRAQLENSTRQPTPVAPIERTNENTFKKLTKEEREAYGEDFIDVSARAAEEKLLPEIEALRKQVAELGGKVETTAHAAHQNTTTVMQEKLDRALPNWKKINRDPKFLAWVNLRDPFSGAIRINMMREAYSNGEAERVMQFFNGFLRDEAIVDPAAVPKQDVTPQGKVSLEELAAPGRAKASAASVAPGEKETITRAQISEFYRRVNTGYYRGNDAERLRDEQVIFDAQRDGRIV